MAAGLQHQRHWSHVITEVALGTGPDGILNLPVVDGGSDNGAFPYFGDSGQVILEVNNEKVAGYTRRDIVAWIHHCYRNGNAVTVRTVPPGLITRDLRQYLNSRFQKNSLDHDLQNTIRDNLYLRTVPCTTRHPREGEVNGVDYTFLKPDEFMSLERSGNLLESGIYEGNHYGTPKPPKENPAFPHHSNAIGHLNPCLYLPGAHPSSEGKRRRNRSNVEAMASKLGEPEPSVNNGPGTPTSNFNQPPPLQRPGSAELSRSPVQISGTNLNHGGLNSPDLGPLPSNWEKAYTEKGEPYFIDHTSGTSHWLDPRLARIQKKAIEECEEGELPYGWEKIDDPHYGTYYIDHVNRRTQYENPVLQAKYSAQQSKPNENANPAPYPHSKKSNGETVPEPRYNEPGTVSNKHENSSQSGLSLYLPCLPCVNDPSEPGPATPPHQLSLNPTNSGDEPAPSNASSKTHGDNTANPEPLADTKPFFTRNPAELQGEFIRTCLVKSTRGFGFTIIGGDEESEEFLQIKSVVPNGPAWQDGKLNTGDVLVYVNDICVLGYTHQDVVTLFQSFPPDETVDLEVCRGYPLPFDPNDPNTEIVTTVAVSFADTNLGESNALSNGTGNGRAEGDDASLHLNRPPKVTADQGRYSGNSGNDGRGPQRYHSADLLTHDGEENGLMGGKSDSTPDILDFFPQVPPKPEFFTVHIVKGASGFGFTITDSAYGQKVKKILDRPRCHNLMEGDILVEINNNSVKGMPHADVVQVLKDCPHGLEASIRVQRGGGMSPGKARVKPLKSPRQNDPLSPKRSVPTNFNHAFLNSKNPDGSGSQSLFRSKTPTAELYSSRDKEVAPNRPKTPLVDTRVRPKTPVTLELHRPKTPNTSTDPSHRRTPVNDDRSVMFGGVLNNGSLGAVDNGSRNGPVNNVSSMDLYYRNAPNQGSMVSTVGSGPYDYNNHNSAVPNLIDQINRTNLENTNGYDGNEYSNPSAPGLNNANPKTKVQVGKITNRVNNVDHIRSQSLYDHESERTDLAPRDDYGHVKNPYSSHTSDSHGYNSEYYKHEADHAYLPDAHYGRLNSSAYEVDSFSKCTNYSTRIKTPTHDINLPSPSTAYPSSQYLGPYNNIYGVQNSYGIPAFGTDVDESYYAPQGQSGEGYMSARDPAVYAYTGSNNSPYYATSSNQGNVYGNPETSVQKQSTSFEHEQPSPSSLTRVTFDRKGFPDGSVMPQQRAVPLAYQHEFLDLTVTLYRQETGFGFRIVGGTEEGSQVSIGHIVPGGAADLDGRLRSGDEIIYVDGQLVLNTSHRHVVQLMGAAAANGHVTLIIRRKGQPQGSPYHNKSMETLYPYDITVNRRENEGFGFVIISSVTRAGSAIGRIIENSPAERCGQLHVGDRILAVNRTNIMNLHHGEIVNLIKDSGYSVTLTIGPPQDDASSTASTSHRGDEQVEDDQYYAVELGRGTRGFGFSIRGGKEFQNMPLFVLRIADTGPAAQDGRLRIGDQIVEINGMSTKNMTHAEAIEIIKQGGSSVRLLVKRGNKLPPALDQMGQFVTSLKSTTPVGCPPQPSMMNVNGPLNPSSAGHVGQSMDKELHYWDYETRPV